MSIRSACSSILTSNDADTNFGPRQLNEPVGGDALQDGNEDMNVWISENSHVRDERFGARIRATNL